MSECRNLEPLFAAYVDDEVPANDQARVAAHLDHCPPCRDRVVAERTARDVIRARRPGLRVCASEHLRQRCAAHAARTPTMPEVARPGIFARRRLLPLSLAATLLLAIGGVFLFGLNDGVEALAAQLAIDHIKCFQFAPDHTTVDADAVSRTWKAKYGWPLKVPSSASTQELVLLDVRRCLSTDGITAHVLYRWHGQPLSVYVLNNVPRNGNEVERAIEKLGQEAIVWSKQGRTYAVVARARPDELDQVVKHVHLTAE
jgi:anti-sigma factor RsiW